MGMNLKEFFRAVQQDPLTILGMEPLLQFKEEGHSLQPGELLAEYPFFCTQEAENGVSLSAVPAMERRFFLAKLYREMQTIPEGGTLNVEITE